MDDKLILTIDMGTQSLRAGLVNKKGEIVAIHKEKYEQPYFSNKIGYSEQDPNFYVQMLGKACKTLLNEHKDLINNILAVSYDCFRDSAVMCDENMKPLRPCILWLDQRQAEGKEKISWYSHFCFWIAGKYDTLILNRRRTPAHWVKENEPEIWSKVKRYMNISTYVIYNLINEYKDTASDYVGHFPIDFKRRKFYKSNKHFQGQAFGVSLDKLCELVESNVPLGTITKEASELTGIPEGLKLFVPGSDKACEGIGLGVVSTDTAAVSCGTASTVGTLSKRYLGPEPLLPAYPSAVPGYFNTETQIYRGFWMLGWFAREFAQRETEQSQLNHIHVEDILNEQLNAIPPGSNGLVLQPYWGPGLERPLSRGAVIGFSDTHTKMHLYRAIIEGIDYELRHGLEDGIEKRFHKSIKRIMIGGGASQSDAICQIAADIFNRPTYRVQTFETSSLGSALCTFLALKEFNSLDEAVNAMVHRGDEFVPIPENAKHYNYLYKYAYKKLYPSLKTIYKDIKLYEEKH